KSNNLTTQLKLAGNSTPLSNTPSYSSITFTLNAKVRDDAVGDIMNTIEVGDQKTPLPQPIKSSKPSIVIEKKTSVSPAIYAPGKAAGFDITLTNTGKGYAQNVYFSDIYESLVTSVVGSDQKHPAITHWDKAEVHYSSDKSYLISGGVNDIGYEANFVIAPSDVVTIHLEGKVIDNAIGSFTNLGYWSEEISGTSGQASVTYYPPEVDWTLEKKAVNPTFTPGEDARFTVTFTNTGLGWAKVNLLDDFASIQTEGLGGTKVDAFTKDSLRVSYQSDYEPINVSFKDNVLTAEAYIPPGKTLTFTTTATTHPEAMGMIVNTAVSDTQSDQASISPKLGKTQFSKRATRVFYQVDEQFVIDLKLVNISDESVNNAVIKDAVSAMRVETVDGSLKMPFTDWKIILRPFSGEASVIDNFTGKPFETITQGDLDVTVDLTKGSEVTFAIVGTVIPDAVGKIHNRAVQLYADDTQVRETKTPPEPYRYFANKQPDNKTYEPTQPFSFTIRVTNHGDSIINKKLLTDNLNAIEVILVDGTKGQAFVPGSTKLTPIDVPTTSIVTKIDDENYELTLFPGEQVQFKAEGTVVAEAVGEIINTAYFDGEPFSSVSSTPRRPEITASFTVQEKYYVPGESLTYQLRLENQSDFPANKIYLQTRFQDAQGKYIHGGRGNAFDNGHIKPSKDISSLTSYGEVVQNQDLETYINLGPKGWVEYHITPQVDLNMLTPISVDAYYTFNSADAAPPNPGKDPTSTRLSVRNVPPVRGEMDVAKTTDKTSYLESDKQVVYTLLAENPSDANLAHIILKDDLSAIKTQKGRPVFTGWHFDAYENDVRLPENQQPAANKDLYFTWDFASHSRNKITIQVTADLNSGVDEAIKNTVFAIDPATEDAPKEAEVTAQVYKKSQNQGQLQVKKFAKQTEVKANGLVEYEIVVVNPKDSVFEGFAIVDHYPAGFRYVDGSATIHLGAETLPAEPVVTSVLTFSPITLHEHQHLRLRYLLKANSGLPYGQYTNSVEAENSTGIISNTSRASVMLLGDKLFDTGSIIGKVFHDHTGNGIQSEATARQISVKVSLLGGDYVPNSTQLILPNAHHEIWDNAAPAIESGVTIDRLDGVSSRSKHTHSAHVRFKTRSSKSYPLTIATKAGTKIQTDLHGKLKKQLTANVKNGINCEDIKVNYRVYRQSNDYLHDIQIDNVGLQDEGLPGVRLITAEGFKCETDEFGRFHVPDRWVLDSKGKNFLIKVDEDSLPAGMKVISENPKIQRVTPNKLNRFNFAVQ
ncbi:MAG: hypothetical protein OXE99_15065, partial [Cellvibrionales bacterium]|nr:hypothetical protein [Cellvibrionales bacterium]